MLYFLKYTNEFLSWMKSFKAKDRQARELIVARMQNMGLGHFGQIRSVGEGVSESKISYGPGYRLYYTIRNLEIVVLLIGGDKTTQEEDIKKAKKLAKELEL